MKKKEKKDDSTRIDIFTGAFLMASVFILWILSWIFIDKYIVSTSPGESNETIRGVFGDKFGAVNALFSGLAFAGIIFTIFLQKRELTLQREELEQTRNEFTQQNETLKKQRFENTFFHLLNLHNEIVDKLYITRDEGVFDISQLVTYSKKDFFNGALDVLSKQNNIGEKFEKLEDSWSVIKDGYRNFNFEFGRYLSHYFRNLYHIYKYVHLSDLISPKEKEFYTSIIRAQLSDSELILIFYNTLVDGLGYPNFKFLQQEYDILQNIDESMLFNESHMKLYDYAKVKMDPFEEKS